MSCLFCDIVNGKIKTEFVFENDEFVAFNDINPQAPEHLLIVPKKHIDSIDEVTPADAPLLGKMLNAVKDIAKNRNLAGGYRVVVNCGPDAGQAVNHIHIHLMGGRKFSWPPG